MFQVSRTSISKSIFNTSVCLVCGWHNSGALSYLCLTKCEPHVCWLGLKMYSVVIWLDFLHIVSPLLPLWFTAVCAFSLKRLVLSSQWQLEMFTCSIQSSSAAFRRNAFEKIKFWQSCNCFMPHMILCLWKETMFGLVWFFSNYVHTSLPSNLGHWCDSWEIFAGNTQKVFSSSSSSTIPDCVETHRLTSLHGQP